MGIAVKGLNDVEAIFIDSREPTDIQRFVDEYHSDGFINSIEKMLYFKNVKLMKKASAICRSIMNNPKLEDERELGRKWSYNHFR